MKCRCNSKCLPVYYQLIEIDIRFFITIILGLNFTDDYFCLETSKTEASVCVQAVDKSVSFLQSFWLCQRFYPANQDQCIKPAIKNPAFNTNFASGELQNHIKPAQNSHLVLDVPILFMCLPNYLSKYLWNNFF